MGETYPQAFDSLRRFFSSRRSQAVGRFFSVRWCVLHAAQFPCLAHLLRLHGQSDRFSSIKISFHAVYKYAARQEGELTPKS